MELIVSGIAVVISFLSMVVSVLTYVFGLLREKKLSTLQAFSLLQQEALDELNSYTKKQITEISENPRSQEYKHISALLARCEHFAVGVQEYIYNIKTLHALAGRYLIALYDKLEPLILKKRTINTQAKHYAAFETLAHRLKKMK